MTRQEARENLFERIGENQEVTLKNTNDGEEALLTRTGIRKMMSEAAVNKSIENGFTAKQHFAVASDIENLFNKSFKVLKHSDKDGDANIVDIHRFATPLGMDDAVAYITVKESTEHRKRIYSIENMKIEKLESTLRDLDEVNRPGTLSQRASLYNDNIINYAPLSIPRPKKIKILLAPRARKVYYNK
jgi:hypothetical protein